MIEEAEIRAKLIRLLNGEIGLAAFDSWLTTESWNMHRAGDPGAQRLASAILLAIAEYDAEDRPHAKLLRDLELLASNVFASVEVRDDSVVPMASTGAGTGSSSHLLPVSELQLTPA